MSNVITDGTQAVAVAGTRLALSATSVKVLSIAIRAGSSNTGVIVVGGATVVASYATRRGYPLAVNESIALNAGHSGDGGALDLADVYIDGTVGTDKVTWMALKR